MSLDGFNMETLKTTENISLAGIKTKAGEPLNLRCYSDEGATTLLINACRADFAEIPKNNEDPEITAEMGQGLLTGGMIEGRLPAGTWQNICTFDNALNIGPVAPGGYAEFEIRTTLPLGIVAFGLAIRAR